MRALAGLGFATTFVAGAIIYGSGAGTSAAAISAYYADPSQRARQIAGFAIILLASLLLVVFVSTFRGRLAALSGGMTAALLIAANTALAASFLYIPFFVFVGWIALAAFLRRAA